MNKWKVHRIVAYIKSCGEFPYDTHDVEEDIDGILSDYCICDELCPEELLIVQRELMRLAGASQTAEIAQQVYQEQEIEERFPVSAEEGSGEEGW